MIATGTTWEHFVKEKYLSESVCHAWSGHPVYHLPELFFGLHQTTPCWKNLEITPRFLAEKASLTLPLPAGILKCRMENRTFSLEIPDGVKVFVQLPNETLELSGPASIEKKIDLG